MSGAVDVFGQRVASDKFVGPDVLRCCEATLASHSERGQIKIL